MYFILAIIKVKGYKCDVCGHVWISRDRETKQLPIACAKCKSPYWNKSERTKK